MPRKPSSANAKSAPPEKASADPSAEHRFRDRIVGLRRVKASAVASECIII